MALPRGFKAKANSLSLILRHQLGLSAIDPIDLDRLAAHLNVTLVPLSTFAAAHPTAVNHLMNSDPEAFSALYLPIGRTRRVIVYNDAHSIARSNSNVTHEMSHVLLQHPVGELFKPSGERLVNKDKEDEASWLGGLILIPNEAAHHIVRIRIGSDDACHRYGVSSEMLQWRLRTSGALIRRARAANLATQQTTAALRKI